MTRPRVYALTRPARPSATGRRRPRPYVRGRLTPIWRRRRIAQLRLIPEPDRTVLHTNLGRAIPRTRRSRPPRCDVAPLDWNLT
ncbi:hypothetical protein FLP41_01680 (plasmid) [Paracoccus marcusii]|uniref:hypothetical protein n=1 Tax=Paracoccus marcusii TaxID=59779 RepID=UPI002ED33A8E|nr:hypothetical protein FLP41_01680 [Paracoccus marcusii]